MGSEKRDSYMDFLKGIAMILVVAGHTLTDIRRADTLFNLIYSFHMPLLFFVSAYIEEQNGGKYAGREGRMLLRRMSGLLLPYLSWTVIYMAAYGQLADMDAVGFVRVLAGYGQSGLWFFPVLFGNKLMHFLYWMLRKKSRRHTLAADGALFMMLEAAAAALAFLTRQPYLINMLSYAIPYFVAVLLADHAVLQERIGQEWATACAVFFYGSMFPFFSFYHTHWTTQLLRIGLSLCVIVVCCRFRQKWRENAAGRAVCLYGRHSLAIYALHVFFTDYKVYFERIESAALISFLAVMAACAVAAVCVAAAKVIEISSWWRMLLLGKRK